MNSGIVGDDDMLRVLLREGAKPKIPPGLEAAYMVEQRQHPDWSHHQIVTYCITQMAVNPNKYSEENLRKALPVLGEDSCDDCTYFHPTLKDPHLGMCQRRNGETRHARFDACDTFARR
jgi:hypothetical protein